MLLPAQIRGLFRGRPRPLPATAFLAGLLLAFLVVYLYSQRWVILYKDDAVAYFPPPEAHGGWRTNIEGRFIRKLGMKAAELEAFGQYSQSVPGGGRCGTLVIKNGWIVGEWYKNEHNLPGPTRDLPMYLSSNGKSLALALFGIMVKDGREGRIPLAIDRHDRLYDQRWLAEGFPLSDPRKAEITFEQVFQHVSGLCPERTAANRIVEQGRNDWRDYRAWVLGHDRRYPQTASLYFDPGRPEGWRGTGTDAGGTLRAELYSEQYGSHLQAYSSLAFCHLGLVFQNVYGMDAGDLLRDRLLAPLGISQFAFNDQPAKDIKWFSGGGLKLTTRDYGRFAYFLLRDGRWKQERLVPEGWIEHFRGSTRYSNMRSNANGVFGKQYPADMFQIWGAGLNWAFIVPSLDLIALRTSKVDMDLHDEVQADFLKFLFAAVEGYRSE